MSLAENVALEVSKPYKILMILGGGWVMFKSHKYGDSLLFPKASNALPISTQLALMKVTVLKSNHLLIRYKCALCK